MYDVQATVGPVHILKPPFGSDLLKELNDFVHARASTWPGSPGSAPCPGPPSATTTSPSRSGSTSTTTSGWKWRACSGNVSLLNGEPIVHAHITFADEQGRCFGGHLGPNTLVFNMEILLTTLSAASRWSARWTRRRGSPSGTREMMAPLAGGAALPQSFGTSSS